MTTSVDRPVTSSTCFATVTPSSTFSNFTRPAYSVTIGRDVASHIASTLPALTDIAVLDLQRRAVRHLVALALAAVVVVDRHLAGARDHHELGPGVGDVAHQRREADRARRLAFELRRRRGTRCRATDVERAHRELGPRLADRLRGDDAHRFADVDEMATAEIAPVARAAKP